MKVKLIRMGRKGFVFSILAIIITAFIIFFVTTANQPINNAQDAVSTVLQLNGAIHDLDSDIVRGLYITSFRTVLAQIERTTVTGDYLNSSKDSFIEGMINGTIEGYNASTLKNATFTDWLKKTKTILGQRGIIFTYDIINITEFQRNYQYVSSNLIMNYTLSDYRGKRNFNRTVNITVDVPINGLEDPAYYINSFARISNLVNITNDTDIHYLITQSENNSLYIESNLSPDFLMRLDGNFSASPYGIESIVNGQRFLDQGISQYSGRSSVDAMYFSNRSETVVCINNTPSWFRLDDARLGNYQNAVVVSC